MTQTQITTQDKTRSNSFERILDVAAELFAKHGYHGSSMRAIARAAGLTISTVHYHVGSKKELYRDVFHRQFEAEYTGLSEVIEAVTDDAFRDPDAFRELGKRVISVFLSRAVEAPESVRLWVNHWLERADPDLSPEAGVFADFSYPIVQMGLDLLKRGRAAGIVRGTDTELRMWVAGFIWIYTGFFAGHRVESEDTPSNPSDPHNVALLNDFLEHYLDRMLIFTE